MYHYIRQRLLEVLRIAYKDNFDTYSKFLVKLSFKESKKTSKYIFEKKTILINNLSYKPADIFIAALLSLTEHIDIVNRSESHLDRDYFLVFRKLINVAIGRNIITLEDLTKYSDEKMRSKLQAEFSTFKNWDIKAHDFIPEYTYVYVFESFMIKNVLKTNGYQYDKDQGLWIKRLINSQAQEEQPFIEMYKNQAVFKVVNDNSFFIRPVYLLKIKTYAKEEAPLLNALEYGYNPKTNIWVKLIETSNIAQEMNNIEKIPKQKVFITENK
ncbi:hypothetical protein EDD63_15012 [Breznakia blatticola]|uniref:Uncharacterized protein n=1 Tax=Breznakia blatticola TaxID=1754012 RepID=A0A4R7Z8R4_9FIRM|nr:hypothetical protein [Breznakia blatticola]TDW13106.1 hypothetical protein EDD63_15012 [Breznakia blatticola]